MIPPLEHAALGAALLAAAAIGIARGAVHFRRSYDGTDRFYATSFAAVALVALLVGGLFFLMNAVTGTVGVWRLPAALAALAYALLLPVGIWRWLGPEAPATGPRLVS